MRILIPIIACLVLVGGCARHEITLTNKNGETMSFKTYGTLPQETFDRFFETPRQPDTVTLLVKIDSTTYYDGGAEHHWSYVLPDTVMPPGRWYSIEEFLEWSRRFGVGQIPRFVDSVFILSGEE